MYEALWKHGTAFGELEIHKTGTEEKSKSSIIYSAIKGESWIVGGTMAQYWAVRKQGPV